MDAFRQWIQRDQFQCYLNTTVYSDRNDVVFKQTFKNTSGQFFEATALYGRPVVESIAAIQKAIEKRRLIDRGGLLEAIGCPGLSEFLESGNVDHNAVRTQRQAAWTGEQAAGRLVGKRLPEPRDRLAQVRTGLSLGLFFPYQRRQLFAWLFLARVHCEIGEDCFGLAGRQGDTRARPIAEIEATEQIQA